MPRKTTRQPPPSAPIAPAPDALTHARAVVGRLLALANDHLSAITTGKAPPEPEIWSKLYGDKESLASIVVKLAQCLTRMEEAPPAMPPPAPDHIPPPPPDLDLLERYLTRARLSASGTKVNN